MKITRWIGIALITLLVLGAMGFVTAHGLAKVSTSHAQQAQGTEAPDTDNVQEQSGDQNGPDTGTEVQDGTESSGAQAQSTDAGDSDPNQAALQSQAKITLDQATQAALSANPGASVLKSELDNEAGALVYSLELSNGQSVDVDTVTGKIIKTEPAG